MDWEDEFDDGYDDMKDASHIDGAMSDKSAEGGIDPLNIENPTSTYFFLSDDAQDEISGRKRKNVKCRSCGHRFAGEFHEICPKCYSLDIE